MLLHLKLPDPDNTELTLLDYIIYMFYI